MASGSEPKHIRDFFDDIEPLCTSALCGAGGGGFAVVVLRQGVSFAQIEQKLSCLKRSSDLYSDFSIHTVNINLTGMQVHELNAATNNADIKQFLYL